MANQNPRTSDFLPVLEKLLRHRLNPGRADFSSLGDTPDYATAATYFILDLASGQGVEPFISRILSRLLHQLSRNTQHVQVVYHGQVRGRVLWDVTYKTRHSQTFDPNLYVCREVHQRYDTPENQLLLYMMHAIDACLKAVPQNIRWGICYLPQQSQGGFSAGIETIVRIGSMEAAMHRLWRNVHLLDITKPESISPYHLLRAHTSRLEEYSQVERLYQQYRSVVLERSWTSLAKTGQRVLPLPSRLDKDGERWVRLAAEILRGA